MTITIRPYASNDFEPVTRLWRLAREVSLPDFQRVKGHPFEQDRWYFSTHTLRDNQVWVAELDDIPAAFMAIKDDFVDQLYVHPDYWRRGIGEALLNYARSLSPNHVWLYTLQINVNARKFYEKNGFKATRFGISLPPESEPDMRYDWYPE